MTHEGDSPTPPATETADAAPAPEAAESNKKERVLHTRIPAVLETELKRLAGSLRVPVSNLVRTIPDAVDLSAFGVAGHPAISKGAPVEAAYSKDGRTAYVSNYSMYGAGWGPEGSDECHPSDGYDSSFVYRVDTDAATTGTKTLSGTASALFLNAGQVDTPLSTIVPKQGTGPFHTADSPWRSSPVNLIGANAGERVLLRGRVLGRSGQPLPGASLDFWQNAANPTSAMKKTICMHSPDDGPRRMRTDASGSARLKSDGA